MIHKALYTPGTKVTSVKDPKCTFLQPNSTLYFSFLKRCLDPHSFLIQCKVVVVQRGKTGKPRLDYITIQLPTIWPEDPALQDELIKYSSNSGSNFATTIIEPIDDGNFNLSEVSAADFLAFVLSRVMFLNYVCREYSNYNFWPKTPNFILNVFRDTVSKNGSDDLTEYVETLTTVAKREQIVTSLRFLEALLQPAVTGYMQSYKYHYTSCIDKVIKPIAMGMYKKLPEYYEKLHQFTL